MYPSIGYLLLLLSSFSSAVPVTINNLKARLDVNGNMIDAHDGSIQQFEKNGLYYMHAMQYGLCEEPPNYGCDGVSEFNHQTSTRVIYLFNWIICVWDTRQVCQVSVASNQIIISASGLRQT
jgi:hypothetical protein